MTPARDTGCRLAGDGGWRLGGGGARHSGSRLGGGARDVPGSAWGRDADAAVFKDTLGTVNRLSK